MRLARGHPINEGMTSGRYRQEEGQALVELVLVANVLLLVVFAIFQYGAIFSHKIAMTDAARAAVRKAATYGGTDTNDNTLRDAAYAAGVASAKTSSSASNMSIVWTIEGGQWVSGRALTACVSVPGKVTVIGFGIWSGSVKSCSTMRIEKRGIV
jgi:Flp pilus assembly protein TadG